MVCVRRSWLASALRAFYWSHCQQKWWAYVVWVKKKKSKDSRLVQYDQPISTPTVLFSRGTAGLKCSALALSWRSAADPGRGWEDSKNFSQQNHVVLYCIHLTFIWYWYITIDLLYFNDNISKISSTLKYSIYWMIRMSDSTELSASAIWPTDLRQVSSFGSVLSVARLLWILQAEFVGICGDLGWTFHTTFTTFMSCAWNSYRIWGSTCFNRSTFLSKFDRSLEVQMNLLQAQRWRLLILLSFHLFCVGCWTFCLQLRCEEAHAFWGGWWLMTFNDVPWTILLLVLSLAFEIVCSTSENRW